MKATAGEAVDAFGPSSVCGLEQVMSTDDVGFDEGIRSYNRAVHMRFGGEVDDGIEDGAQSLTW